MFHLSRVSYLAKICTLWIICSFSRYKKSLLLLIRVENEPNREFGFYFTMLVFPGRLTFRNAIKIFYRVIQLLSRVCKIDT